MKSTFKIPSKTFLLGEYNVLYGGNCITVNTTKHFELTIKPIEKDKKQQVINIHPNSPAGKYINFYKNIFSKYQIIFKDPYLGAGGFGASSAQFLSLYLFFTLKTGLEFYKIDSINPKDIISTYQIFAFDGIGQKPSGADVISQYYGNITTYIPNTVCSIKDKWPFEDISFLLIHTKNKINTHTHLKSLNLQYSEDLNEMVKKASSSFDNKDSKKFIDAITSYKNELEKNNLIAPETKKILDRLKSNKQVLTSKGCGALGADVVLVIVQSKDKDNFKTWANENELAIIASETNIANGIEIIDNLANKSSLHKYGDNYEMVRTGSI